MQENVLFRMRTEHGIATGNLPKMARCILNVVNVYGAMFKQKQDRKIYKKVCIIIELK